MPPHVAAPVDRRLIGPTSPLLCLPDEIILCICQHLPCQDFFQLGSANHRLHAITQSCGKGTASAIAYSTYPDADLLFDQAKGIGFDGLKTLVSGYLSLVLVTKRRYGLTMWNHRFCVQDTFRPELRARVAPGWEVLAHLSAISRAIYRIPVAQLPHRGLMDFLLDLPKMHLPRNATAVKLNSILQRERLVLRQRIDYIRSLDAKRIESYRLLLALVYDPFVVDGGLMDFVSTANRRHLESGNSWLNWFILHEGPLMLWQQWYYGRERDFVKNKSLQAWRSRSLAQITIERQALEQLQKVLEFDLGPYQIKVEDTYSQSRTLTPDNQKEVEERKILGGVPYLINLRAPFIT
ncbi:hypothetical protein SCUP234_12172 [Seiridium cupressi]